jgi:hypothetical protein
MKFARFAYGTFGFLAVGSLAWGCSSKTNDCDANKTCGPFGSSGASGDSGSPNSNGGKSGSESGGEGGASGEGGDSSNGGNAGSGGAACMPTASPDSAPCVIGDGFGLFVSLSGDDATGDGTEAHPLATVTQALTLTGPGKIDRIYVCATPNGNTTSYDEPDTLAIPDRVSIYGGFTCESGDWKYVNGTQAYIKPESAIGATIASAMNGVTLQDLRIDAQNAPDDGTGASSFGMIVNGSNNVVLTRVEIHAGKGGGGATAEDGATGTDGTGTAGVGVAGSCDVGASAPAGVAALGICGSNGGNGGVGAKGTVHQGGQDGFFGTPQENVDPPQVSNGGPGGTINGITHPGLAGTDGSVGLSGAPGTPAGSIGTLSASGYVPVSGGDGSPGYPGQGGGGGGASLGKAACVGASGGAGGMGGCGGDSGKGGSGGGASIALLSLESVLTLDSVTLVAGAGGAGGNGGKAHPGGLGAAGAAGGPANTSDGIGAGGKGGVGGLGGTGGSGAGGTGGPSFALAYDLKPMKLHAQTLTPGAGGAHGNGGHYGSDAANVGPDGTDGLAQAEFQQK